MPITLEQAFLSTVVSTEASDAWLTAALNWINEVSSQGLLTQMPTSFHVSNWDSEWNPGSPFKAGLKSKRKHFNSTRLAGIEWEYNNNSNDYNYEALRWWARKWRGGNHYDGSCGYEAVTAPIAGDNIESCLKDLSASLIALGVTANSDCSVHVHVDAKDYEWEHIQKLLTVYGRLEPLLYVIAGYKRASNRYCTPCGNAYVKAMLEATDKDKNTAILREAFNAHRWSKKDVEAHHNRARKKDGGRYRGLNIIPWIVGKRDKRKDCTVEFRIHENTLDEQRVINWVHLLVTLIDWCRNATVEDIQLLPVSDVKALSKICPNHSEWILTRIKDWRRHRGTRGKIVCSRRMVFSFTSETRRYRRDPELEAEDYVDR